MSAQESWKVALFGDGAVGKTAIAVKFTRGTFLETYDPTIEDSYRVHSNFQGKAAFLEIVDTAGQDDYATLRDQWLHEGDAYILVYAVSSRRSFNRIVAMDRAIVRARQKSGHIYPVSILVGNKHDLSDEGLREVGSQEGHDLAQRFGCHFVETSAKTGHNVRRLFETLVISMRHRQLGMPSNAPPGTIWDRSVPTSPIAQSPSAFRFPPPQQLAGPSGSASQDPYGIGMGGGSTRSRQASVPGLRGSASAYPLPRSPSIPQSQPQAQLPQSSSGGAGGGAGRTIRGRSSTSALRQPVPVNHHPPPVPPLPPGAGGRAVSAAYPAPPNAYPLPQAQLPPQPQQKGRDKALEKELAKREKAERKEREKRGRAVEGGGGRGGGGGGGGGGGKEKEKDGKCIIC